MNHIKLFGKFSCNESSSHNYLWPDAKFWFSKIEPEELCFLGVYSYLLEMDKKQTLFPVKYEGPKRIDPNEEGVGEFEMFYTFFDNEIEADNFPSLFTNVSFSGEYTRFYPGNFHNPPEGGDYQLKDVTIEDPYYLNLEHSNEYDLDNMEYKSKIISRSDLINLLKYIAVIFINPYDDYTDIKKPSVPTELMEKCERIRNENIKIKRATNMISRFGID
jgi:hypothetical protein